MCKAWLLKRLGQLLKSKWVAWKSLSPTASEEVWKSLSTKWLWKRPSNWFGKAFQSSGFGKGQATGLEKPFFVAVGSCV